MFCKGFSPFICAVLSLLVLGGEPLKPKSTIPDPHFNRLYHNDDILKFLRGYAKAFPDWFKLESIGKTSEGNDTWLITISNPKTGGPDTKPAFYMDGATHANEAQGTETVLYIINFMFHNYGKLDRLTETMDRLTFYIVPIVSPDSRAKWFDEPSTTNYPRTVQVKIDDDRDGQLDEDQFDDLDGDGMITQMRKKVPMGQGTHRLHHKDSRLLVDLEDDELGNYILLGTEGIDNDGDGKINEDTTGYIDPNRTWGYNWQPRYVQAGSTQYPLQIPETRNIAKWALTRSNIAGVQSFHNYGRMILRGPGSKSEQPFPPSDIQVLDFIGEEGEKMLPGYKYMISWKDLYTVYGGTTEHFYGIHGIFSFTNELNQFEQDYDGDGKISNEEMMKFNDELTHGRMFIPWKAFNHPQYGPIEIGGYRFDATRVPEGWKLEEDCHRNSAFVLFNAYHLPKISLGETRIVKLERDLFEVYIPILNDRVIPTMSAKARTNKLYRKDIATIKGGSVITSGVVENEWLKKFNLQKHRPERLMVGGIEGLSTTTLYFLVEGKGEVTFTYDSLKGGKLTKTIALK